MDDIGKIDAAGTQAIIAAIGKQRPKGTKFSPNAIMAAESIIDEAMSKLTGGEMSAYPRSSSKEDGEGMPADMYAALVGFQGMIDSVSKDVKLASKYKIDVEKAASSSDGLIEALQTIRRAANDDNLTSAMYVKQGGGAEPAPEAKDQPKEQPVDMAGELANLS